MPPNAFTAQDDQFQRAFAILHSGIEQRAFPGASVGIVHQGKLIALKGLGRRTYGRCSKPVKLYTIYDLASVTKVVATTIACMILYERGQFHLEHRLADVLPEFERR